MVPELALSCRVPMAQFLLLPPFSLKNFRAISRVLSTPCLDVLLLFSLLPKVDPAQLHTIFAVAVPVFLSLTIPLCPDRGILKLGNRGGRLNETF